jgi:hypothetical protein
MDDGQTDDSKTHFARNVKRKLKSSDEEKEKDTKGGTIMKSSVEAHSHFYPIGPIISLMVLEWRYVREGDEGSLELFGVAPLLSLILDYVGPYSTWSVSRIIKGEFNDESCIISIHQAEGDALRAIVTAWCNANVDTFEENAGSQQWLAINHPHAADDGDENTDDSPHTQNTISLLGKFVRSVQSDLERRRDYVEDIISERYNDGPNDCGALESLRDIWEWAQSWQDRRYGRGLHFELTEVLFPPSPSFHE